MTSIPGTETAASELYPAGRRASATASSLERPPCGERAVLVLLEGSAAAEFAELARTAGAFIAGCIHCRSSHPRPQHYIGRGKLEETAQKVCASSADLVLFDADLTPAQERNLEKALQCRVVDRTGLILDIFARRARSYEGKLQVELACLTHQSTRLVRGWTHLERQRGGIGLRSGPGEAQLETDRRVLRKRIRKIGLRLEQLQRTRGQGRRARSRAGLPIVLLAGYTNAGKSTLFNRMTGASAYTADQLFATLDTTLRRMVLPGGEIAVLGDTVGFIRHLPHSLVAAFHATLEETAQASLLVHVVDAAAEDVHGNCAQVEAVLEEVGAGSVPRLEVFNKIDCLSGGGKPLLERDAAGVPRRVRLSAATGQGCALLAEALAERLAGGFVHRTLRLSPAQGQLRSFLYGRGAVLQEKVEENGWLQLEVRLPEAQWQQLQQQEDGQKLGLAQPIG